MHKIWIYIFWMDDDDKWWHHKAPVVGWSEDGDPIMPRGVNISDLYFYDFGPDLERDRYYRPSHWFADTIGEAMRYMEEDCAA